MTERWALDNEEMKSKTLNYPLKYHNRIEKIVGSMRTTKWIIEAIEEKFKRIDRALKRKKKRA